MGKLTWTIIGAALALGGAPALAHENDRREDWRGWDHDRRGDRHERHHDRLEDRHGGAHDRLEEQHDRAHEKGLTRRQHRRLHDRLERRHDRTHDRLERRHDEHHDRAGGYPYGGDRRGHPDGYDHWRGGYYGLRGEGWARLGWIARDPRLASWVLRNFDDNRNGSLGRREAERAYGAILHMADRNRDGRLSQRELIYWQNYAMRH